MKCWFEPLVSPKLPAAVAVLLCAVLAAGPVTAERAPRGDATPIAAAPAPSEVTEGGVLLAFSEQATGRMERRIRDGAAACGALPWVYRYDCLAETFTAAARINRDRRDYSDASKILKQAGSKLDALVDQNVDVAAPKIRQGRKSYRAVLPSSKATVSRTGRAIIAEAEALLLRSGDTQTRQYHYQKIAAAVSATELLLRSGLVPVRPVRLALAFLELRRG